MSKILFITPSYQGGGAERVVLRLLNEMGSAFDEVHLLVLWDEGPLKADLPEGIVVHNLNCRRTRYAFPGLIRSVYKIRPDIVFTTLSRLNILLLLVKVFLPKGISLLIREANTPSSELEVLPWGRIYKVLYRLLYPFADAIICQSDYMKRDLIYNFGVPADKLVHIYNPVPFKKIDLFSNGISPYNPDLLNFVSIGKLTEQKGYDLLISAVAKVKDELPEFKLTIVGDGCERDALQNLASSYHIGKYVEFVGYQENPYLYCKFADIFISSSRYEGLPNVVLESLACGTPVLATNCPGGTSEIVKEDINGWLVPTEDVNALAEGILRAASQRNKYNSSSIKESVRDYSSEAISEKYINTLKKFV